MSLSQETEFNFPDSYFRPLQMDQSIPAAPPPFFFFFSLSLSFSSAPLDIPEPNSRMDQGSEHLQVIKHDLSFKPESITSKSEARTPPPFPPLYRRPNEVICALVSFKGFQNHLKRVFILPSWEVRPWKVKVHL